MTSLQILHDHILLSGDDGADRRFHHVWLRDNCGCPDCRVVQTGERRLYTADILDDIAPKSATLTADDELEIVWPDGHRSRWSRRWLRAHDHSATGQPPLRERPVLWDAADVERIPRVCWDDLIADPAVELRFLDAMAARGAAVLTDVPSHDGMVATVAERLGHVREVAFERVHNVRHDPTGYNVAHTALELKPHSDLPSYRWPPSVQLLHFLLNKADGGETVLVDGWRVLADLEAADPDAIDVLSRVEVAWQLFSATEDTYAVAPIVQRHPDGTVATFRFSNQLAQPLRADLDTVGRFYDAYRALGRMIDDARYKAVFKAADGDIVCVHGHRVLHGRLPFAPASGARHLQDVYMEFDDLMARRRVLRGEHLPLPTTGDAG